MFKVGCIVLFFVVLYKQPTTHRYNAGVGCMKKELSMLEEQLIDEYFRGKRHIDAYTERISSYPKGSISKKNIRGNDSYYLQWREGKHVRSKYVNRKDVEALRAQIEARRSGEKNIRQLKQDLKKIEKFLGKKLIEGYAEGYRG